MKNITPALILFEFILSPLMLIPSHQIVSAAGQCELYFENFHREPKEVQTGQSVEVFIQPTEKGKTYSIVVNNYFNQSKKREGESLKLTFSLTFNEPGTYTIQAYQGTASDINNSDRYCTGVLEVKVTGEPIKPPPLDPTCHMTFLEGGAGAEREIEQGETISVSVGGTVQGDFYNIKSNGERVDRALSPTFPLVFNEVGTYTITGWHETASGELKCSGDLTVIVKAGGTDGGLIVKPRLDAGNSRPVNEVAGAFAKTFLNFGIGIAGGIAFLLMVFGSYRLIFAGGDPEAIQQGKQIITAAIAGLIVIVFSVFILELIGITIFGLNIGL